ncbi:hypothetical protein BOX15_Mlig030023g1, partial [Macrostomum lignano]
SANPAREVAVMSSSSRTAVFSRMAEDQLYLNRACLVGYCDLNASSLRALLGIEARVEFWDLDVPGLPCGIDDGAQQQLLLPACERWDGTPPMEGELKPLQVLNLKYEQYSLILVNSHVPPSRVHLVMQRVFQLFEQFKVSRVHLLSCLHLPDAAGNPIELLDDIDDRADGGAARLTETAFNGAADKLDPGLPSLDLTARPVRDAFLCCFVQFALVDRLPFTLLACVRHRAKVASVDSPSVAAFQACLADRLGLAFSLERSLNGIRFHRQPVSAGGDSGMYV